MDQLAFISGLLLVLAIMNYREERLACIRAIVIFLPNLFVPKLEATEIVDELEDGMTSNSTDLSIYLSE